MTDIILAIILIALGFFGLRKGFIASIIHFIGFFVAFILMMRYAPLLQALLLKHFDINPLVTGIIAYVTLFIIVMVITRILILLMEKLIDLAMLKFVDRLLGFTLGLAIGFFIVCMLYTVLWATPLQDYIIELESKSAVLKAASVFSREMRQIIGSKLPSPPETNIESWTLL